MNKKEIREAVYQATETGKVRQALGNADVPTEAIDAIIRVVQNYYKF